MHRSIPALAAAVVTALPVSGAWVATHPAVHARTKQKPKTRKIVGPSVGMRWGPIQVTIVVTGRKIVSLSATAPMERPRSAFINNQAIPWLRQEALQAQSAQIDLVGGATMTSQAFAESLQAALTRAGL